jgi:hypothetical protein
MLAVVTAAMNPPCALAQNTLPPDQQAFRSARLTEDAQQQLDALLKVAADYPESRYAPRAHSAALDILVTKFPARLEDIKGQMHLILKDAKPDDWVPYASVASTLADGGVLLEEARRISEQTIKRLKEDQFLARTIRQFEEAKIPPPSREALQRTYRNTRSLLLGILGKIRLKQGDTNAARRVFEEAERTDPISESAEGLGVIAFSQGREETAYEYLLRARVTGVPSAENVKLLEMLFAKRHTGRAGLEEALDQVYRKYDFNPIVRRPYAPTSASTDRTALLEMFTGASCGPCAGGDIAVDAIRERFDPRQLIVLMYHVHVPGPDPMTNPDGVMRASYYSAQGAPTFVVDGANKETGGGSRHEAQRPYERVNAMLEKALQEPAQASLSLSATLTGKRVSVQARAGKVAAAASDLKLRIALVEHEIRYSGENGIRFHPMVVRAITEFALDPLNPSPVTAEFDVDQVSAKLKVYLDEYERRNDKFGPITFVEKKFAIDSTDLAVVAFLQSDNDRQILQSAFVDLRVPNGDSQ